jgi:hypothetical protein
MIRILSGAPFPIGALETVLSVSSASSSSVAYFSSSPPSESNRENKTCE